MNHPRLLSLDIFRGITIALMILVNSPGNETAYPLLEHSAWNGCTFADLVFPFFLFIVGLSIAIAFKSPVERRAPVAPLLTKIIKRALIIFLIGLFLNAFPYHFHFATIRVYGVLQRIAICYLIVSLLFITTHTTVQAMFAASLLIAYWLLMTKIPSINALPLTPENNLGAYLDRRIFAPDHLYDKIFDPEGLLSTLPALATTLLGTLTGTWLGTSKTHNKKLQGLVIAGVFATAAGWLWGLWFPINKGIWTSTYVLWTGGLALLLLALLFWLIEIKHWKKWSKPFEIFGLNAIAAYFLHIFLLKIQAMIHLPRMDGTAGNLRIYLSEHLFGWTSLQNASLLYAVSYILFCLFILAFLYRHKIFIKV